jgi:hypothetical protein
MTRNKTRDIMYDNNLLGAPDSLRLFQATKTNRNRRELANAAISV